MRFFSRKLQELFPPPQLFPLLSIPSFMSALNVPRDTGNGKGADPPENPNPVAVLGETVNVDNDEGELGI